MVPAEGTDAELNDSELLGGVFDFEIPNIEPVELERLPPRSAGDSGHLQVDRNEVGISDKASKVVESCFEVGFRDFLLGEGRCCCC